MFSIAAVQVPRSECVVSQLLRPRAEECMSAGDLSSSEIGSHLLGDAPHHHRELRRSEGRRIYSLRDSTSISKIDSTRDS